LWNKTEVLSFSKSHKVDIIFIIFFVGFSVYFYWNVSISGAPPSDGAEFLNNARGWLSDTPLKGVFRAPLISWIIAGVWLLTGENWLIIKYLIPAFTLGAGIMLYILLRKRKGNLFALGVSVLTLLNQNVFFWGTFIMTEGLSLFFLVLSVYFLKSEKEKYWIFAGIAIGLTFGSRYSIFIQALTIFLVELVIRRNSKFATRTMMSAIPIVAIFILVPAIKTGTFLPAAETDAGFTLLLSPYYLQNSIDIWGLSFILVPIAFMFRRTYTDKYNYAFIAWFIVSFVFWSAASNPIFQIARYTVQFTPAVYYLAILAIENIAKTNLFRKSVN
jgi:4-amino-4-deoxy-L-arabinose transferase-like glycosyltransferase